MRVLVLLYPRMIPCDARLGFQDDLLLVHRPLRCCSRPIVTVFLFKQIS